MQYYGEITALRLHSRAATGERLLGEKRKVSSLGFDVGRSRRSLTETVRWRRRVGFLADVPAVRLRVPAGWLSNLGREPGSFEHFEAEVAAALVPLVVLPTGPEGRELSRTEPALITTWPRSGPSCVLTPRR